jgi:acetyl-CoA carboxylase carboxyltransferase component
VPIFLDLFKSNETSMKQLLASLDERLKESVVEGAPRTIEQHRKLGKLLPRERIQLLLDDDAPFLEICALSGYAQVGVDDCGPYLKLATQNDAVTGGTTICGIGTVCGVECMISSNRYTVKGGTVDEATLRRSGRCGEIARENNLPMLMLVESGGANLTQQFKVFHNGGGAFYQITRQSRARVPQISVVFGSSTAGGAYTPGMSDYVVMVKQQAKVFLGGPPLVKMATGEVTDAESLGGAEMHRY